MVNDELGVIEFATNGRTLQQVCLLKGIADGGSLALSSIF